MTDRKKTKKKSAAKKTAAKKATTKKKTVAKKETRGRPKQKSPAYKTKAWWDERNKRRREKYRKDKEYRDKAVQASRKRYREDRGTSPDDQHCAVALADLSAYGDTRKVVLSDGKVAKRKCFTKTEMAEVLGDYNVVALYRWLRKERFPEAKAEIAEGAQVGQKVYLADETRKLVKVMAEHQKDKAYLTAEDTDTIAKLHEAME